MNPDTRVAACCYAGDAAYVIENLPLYLHHECPFTVLSPDDSRADIRYPGVDNLFGGKRAYVGQECLDRMRVHLKLLLQYPENHFLIHDSDSVCLSPKLPDYLYDEPDTLWSNLVQNNIPEQQPGFPADIPHIAFQPPWFLSRRTIKTLLDVSEDCTVVNLILPFIDYWMVEMAVKAGLPWKRLANSISVGLSSDEHVAEAVAADVRERGLIFVHSVKGGKHAAPLIKAREQFLRGAS